MGCPRFRRTGSAGSLFTDKLYTGQREVEGLGLYHYKARFYSPALGRFLSADTIIPGAANPQSWNRYSYVTNNPLRYTDPTGHMMDDGGDGGGGVTTVTTCNIWNSDCGGGLGGDGGSNGGGGSGGCNNLLSCSGSAGNNGSPFQGDGDPPTYGPPVTGCMAQIGTDNYWANTCGGINGSDYTHMYITNPGQAAYNLFEYDSPQLGFFNILMLGAPYIASEIPIYRLPWKTLTVDFLEAGQSAAFLYGDQSYKAFDDILASRLALAADKSDAANIYIIHPVYNMVATRGDHG